QVVTRAASGTRQATEYVQENFQEKLAYFRKERTAKIKEHTPHQVVRQRILMQRKPSPRLSLEDLQELFSTARALLEKNEVQGAKKVYNTLRQAFSSFPQNEVTRLMEYEILSLGAEIKLASFT
ncbi:hypothetical protein COY95_02250, partial [Candidatus Woesearchaeota archaeon CG_4_10_14_0_8_um_filter_47_5]